MRKRACDTHAHVNDAAEGLPRVCPARDLVGAEKQDSGEGTKMVCDEVGSDLGAVEGAAVDARHGANL